MGKSVVISQSNYVPWKGYFDLAASADEFVIFDEVQFTRRDWRNRNRIILAGRPQWLSIPVLSGGRFDAPIDSIVVAERNWAQKHMATLQHAYGRSEYFEVVRKTLWPVFEQAGTLDRLTEINRVLLNAVCQMLGIATPFTDSRATPRSTKDPTERLVEICVACGANEYISGPAARSYIRPELFRDAGIALSYADYAGYEPYRQMTETFDHAVSILDVLFRCGPVGARSHLKSVRDRTSFVSRLP